jgi:hypothetical protein
LSKKLDDSAYLFTKNPELAIEACRKFIALRVAAANGSQKQERIAKAYETALDEIIAATDFLDLPLRAELKF